MRQAQQAQHAALHLCTSRLPSPHRACIRSLLVQGADSAPPTAGPARLPRPQHSDMSPKALAWESLHGSPSPAPGTAAMEQG